MIKKHCQSQEIAPSLPVEYVNYMSVSPATLVFCENHIELHFSVILDKNQPSTLSPIRNVLLLDFSKINQMEIQYKNSEFQILTLCTDYERITLQIRDSSLVRQQLGIHVPQTNFREHYQILEKIRQGGQGQIVKCLSYDDNKVYAAKILNHSSYSEQEVVVQKILAKNPHQNVLSMIEFFEDERHTIIIFPYISGGTLYQELNNEEKNIKKILKQILKGVQHIHKLGLIHRDIKMDNIMMDSENKTIKIIDFGFAIFQSESSLIEERCGTLNYMAPEVVFEEEYDEKADIFSLAQVFHILATGQPFRIRRERGKGNYAQIDKSEIMEPQFLYLLNNMIKRKIHRFSAAQCLQHEYFQKKLMSDRVICLKSLIFKSPFSTPDDSPI